MATFMTEFASGMCKYNAVGDTLYASKYTMTTTGSATDVFQLCKVQPGARVLGIKSWADTANLSYSIGDGDNTGKFQRTASGILTVGAATASAVYSVIRNIDVGTGLSYSYSVADTIDLRIDAAGGGTGAVIYYVVELSYDSQQVV